jgi:CCR4-NOT transcriptional regulation complex NOT5 subunit
MIKWICKKIILRELNKVLDRYADDIISLRKILVIWIARLETIIKCIKNLLKKLDDGKIDSEEIDEAAEDVKFAIKNW